MALSFDWDARKDAANRRKHGVDFEEAMSVFYDENALLLDDERHSQEEERFVLIGVSGRLRILVVCHCYRDPEDVIRIISARKAIKTERDEYFKRLRP